jgi:hypothetical protein
MDTYRLVALICGLAFSGIGAGIGLLFPFSSNIAILSFLTALGSSTIFHALLGGLTKAEQDKLTLSADGQPVKIQDFLKLTGNVKVSGPLVSFIIIAVAMFVALSATQNNRDKSISHTQSILKNIEINPTKGIVIDTEGNLYGTLTLKYQDKESQSQVFEHEIQIAKKKGELLDTEFLQTKQLGIESKLDEQKVLFDVKDSSLRNILGFFDSQDLKEVLRKLAENTSEPNTEKPNDIPLGNSFTKSILLDCVRLTGLCKQPDQFQIKLSFNTTGTLPQDIAYACPKGLALSRLKLVGSNNTTIVIVRELNGKFLPVKIKNLIPFEDSSVCQQNPNLVQISGKHSTTLFPTGADRINLAYISITPKGEN